MLRMMQRDLLEPLSASKVFVQSRCLEQHVHRVRMPVQHVEHESHNNHEVFPKLNSRY